MSSPMLHSERMERKGMSARSSLDDAKRDTTMLAGSTVAPISAMKKPARSELQAKSSEDRVGTLLTTSSCPVLLTR